MRFKPSDDKKFYLEIPEPGFSPARNKMVIENSIRKYEANQRAKRTAYLKDFGERADAISVYFKVLRQGRRPHLKKFFSKKYLAYLRGEEIRQEYMANLKMVNNKGKIITLN